MGQIHGKNMFLLHSVNVKRAVCCMCMRAPSQMIRGGSAWENITTFMALVYCRTAGMLNWRLLCLFFTFKCFCAYNKKKGDSYFKLTLEINRYFLSFNLLK